MTELNFTTTLGDETIIKCNPKDKIKDVCKNYAKRINKRYKQLVFFNEISRINKKLTVEEFLESAGDDFEFILVKIMDIDVEVDSDEEIKKKEEKNYIDLKKKITEQFKNPISNPTYEEMKELVVEYGYYTEKEIEREQKEHPENFIKIKEAIKKEDSDKQLFILGKLGETLEKAGIKVAIDKRKNLNDNNYIINNQIISSGILDNNKYEIHIKEDDEEKKHKILYEEKEKKKFIEKMKNKIIEYVPIDKDNIYIGNIREGSLKMDVVFKTKTKKINQKFIHEKMKIFANADSLIIGIFEKNIIGACKLTYDMLDTRGDQLNGNWQIPPAKRGGFEYFPPNKCWIGFGLRVWDKYDNRNNDWIGMDGNKNEWAVAYHGTSEKAVKPIFTGKFYSTTEEGAERQKCELYKNINKKSNKKYPKCGEGTYCSPYLEYAGKYSKGVIIMCRVNPNLIRIPEGKHEKYEWITDGTKKSIRPYRILYKIK